MPAAVTITKNPPRKLDSLTGLRFYLAMFVLFYHGIIQAHLGLGVQALPPGLLEFLRHTCNGQYAVGSFFVLSGFVMWYSYSERKWTARQFLGNRVARLYPIYLLGIAIVLLRWNSLLQEFETTYIEALRRLALSALMLQSWGTTWRTTQMFNGPGWTLSVEMFFYATFPALFWISRRSKLVFLGTCGTITLLTLLLSVFGSKDYSVNPLNIPICAQYWGLFTLGILLCYTWQRGIVRYNPGALPSLLLLFLGYQLSRWVSGGIMGMAVPFLLIGWLATADLHGHGSRWFSSKWAVLGGEISYAIYILHMPIQSIVYSLFFRSGIFLLKVDNMALKLTYLSICVVATLVASYLAWRFIEVPARKKIVAWLAPKPA